MSVDPLRHISVFPPHAFGARRVDVIGCGATGSRVLPSLANLRVENIHAWDFDRVEEHNLANQVFRLKIDPSLPDGEPLPDGTPNTDVGLLKVEALKHIVLGKTGVAIQSHAEKADGSQPLGEVVFLLTDTMSSRKEIWEKGLKFKLQTRLAVETRMGADNGRIYALNPNLLDHIRAWEEAWYPDEEAEVSACGASISVGPTAEIIAGLAVWQMVRWFAVEEGGEDALDNEIIFGLRSTNAISRQF